MLSPGAAFDAQELHGLVDLALGRTPLVVEMRNASAVCSPRPPSGPAPVSLPLGMHDTHLFGCLASALDLEVGTEKAATVLAKLRAELCLDTPTTLSQVHTAVTHCRRCPNLANPGMVPFGNLAAPDVVFLVDNQHLSARWQDEWVRLVAAAGFAPTSYAVSALTRCATPERRSPELDEITNCAGYLSAELDILQPTLVVTIGALTANTVLGPGSLSSLRGQVFWIGPWAVLATYSPAYAAKSDEGAACLASDLARAHAFVYGAKA